MYEQVSLIHRAKGGLAENLRTLKDSAVLCAATLTERNRQAAYHGAMTCAVNPVHHVKLSQT